MDTMDANAARTLNIRQWVAASGGPAEFAERYGGGRWVAAQVSQWISETSPKGIGHKLARDIESKLGKPAGAMDRPADSATEPSSQSLRIDPDILALSIAALRRFAQRNGYKYDPETHPMETVRTYELRCAMSGTPTEDELIDFVARVAELFQQQTRGKNATGGDRTIGADDRKRDERRAAR